MADVALDHLSKVYANGVQAVRELSLTVADGELVVLLGPSGCGKTTILRLIAGLEVPTAGTVAINGKVVNDLPARQRNVAMVFQKSTLYPHMDVRRNIGFGLKLQQNGNLLAKMGLGWLRTCSAHAHETKRDIAEKVERTAQLLGLGDVLERRPYQLSGGQQQRVALGRAIARAPDVFLLDEPLSQLDGKLRAELRHELHLLQRRLRKTMIYVTHDQAEAMTLADRLVVMDGGVVQQANAPLAVYEQPCNRFVASFLGWPGMNFIDGRLIEKGGVVRLEAPGLSLALPPAKAIAWAAHVGRRVTLGLRPEHVRPTFAGQAGLAMCVVLVESLGAEYLVTLERDGLRITARLGERVEMKHQQTIEVGFQMEHAHLFDLESGVALNPGRPAG